MSRRKNPRRSAAVSVQCYGHLSDSDDETISNLMLSFQNRRVHLRNGALPKATKKRVQKKDSRGNLSNLTCDTGVAETKPNLIDDIDVDNMRKKIANKIDTVFKDSSLISDDDDVIVEKVDPPPVVSKDFYVLTDSDEEEHCIIDSTPAVEISPVSSKPVTDSSNKDELMDIVDEILDCDNIPVEVNVEADKSWTEYKKKTEEMLNSVSTLLDSIKSDEKEKHIPGGTSDRSPENKPSCPVCLETFGDTVKAATTLCGHIFCFACINAVAKTTKRCPTCRKIVNAKKFHAVYF